MSLKNEYIDKYNYSNMASLSYNQMISLFEDIADNHAFIKRFGFGQIYDIESFIGENSQYPVMWVAPVSVEIGEQILEYKFNILIFDLLQRDKSNENEILSDSLRTMVDVCKVLRFNSYDYEISGSFQAIPFTEEFSDFVTGHRIEVDIITSIEDNMCATYAEEVAPTDIPEPVEGEFTFSILITEYASDYTQYDLVMPEGTVSYNPIDIHRLYEIMETQLYNASYVYTSTTVESYRVFVVRTCCVGDTVTLETTDDALNSNIETINITAIV